jgi:serine/threonine-protein kinase SRPK3
MIELLGPIPKFMTQTGKFAKDIFNGKGELRHIHKLRSWPLVDVLIEKYQFERKNAEESAEFLIKMCTFSPEKRSSARQLLQEAWVDGDSNMNK